MTSLSRALACATDQAAFSDMFASADLTNGHHSPEIARSHNRYKLGSDAQRLTNHHQCGIITELACHNSDRLVTVDSLRRPLVVKTIVKASLLAV